MFLRLSAWDDGLLPTPTIATFLANAKKKQLLMKEILMIYLTQFILRLYQTYKIFLENARIGLFTQS